MKKTDEDNQDNELEKGDWIDLFIFLLLSFGLVIIACFAMVALGYGLFKFFE